MIRHLVVVHLRSGREFRTWLNAHHSFVTAPAGVLRTGRRAKDERLGHDFRIGVAGHVIGDRVIGPPERSARATIPVDRLRSSAETDESCRCRGEAAGVEVELTESSREVDMEPLAVGFTGADHRVPDEFGADSPPPVCCADRGVEDEGVQTPSVITFTKPTRAPSS